MWYEIVVGFVVGLGTYLYLHYLGRRRAQAQLEESVAEQALLNANETGTENESMDWLNFLIKHWYLYVDESFQEMIKEMVQPILDDLDLPPPITGVELETITFGEHPPFIQYTRSVKDHWEDDPNLQALELVLGPRIDSDEFKVKLNVKGIGHVVMTGFRFTGELQVTMLMDKSLDFPCIRHVFITFQERPDIHFDIEYGNVGIDVIPAVKNWIMDMIEEVVSDTLVDPGRFLFDMSSSKPKIILIKGVRKLKRTVLHVQVEISKNQVNHPCKEKTISCILNTGGHDHQATLHFTRKKQTLHIWFPLAVLQEEIKLAIYHVKKLATDEKLSELVLDINSLTRDKTVTREHESILLTDAKLLRELNRTQNTKLNLLTVVKATAYELPYIPLRQSKIEVVDYSQYFKIPALSRHDVIACPSGLVYFHIHRATGLPAKDKNGKSDPYCKVKLNGEKLFRTKTVMGSLDPIFNHFEDFFVSNILQTSITIEIVDYDWNNRNDEIGKINIDLRDVAPKLVNRGFAVLSNNGTKAGTVYLSVIFRPIQFPPTSEDVLQSLVNNIGRITILE